MRRITTSRAEKLEGIPIGELSRLTSVNIETIRYYEKIKMLQAPPRTEGGHRVYGPTETRVLAFIRRARELGFSLDEIRALLDLGGPGKASCADVRNVATRHLDDIRAATAEQHRMVNRVVLREVVVVPHRELWQGGVLHDVGVGHEGPTVRGR